MSEIKALRKYISADSRWNKVRHKLDSILCNYPTAFAEELAENHHPFYLTYTKQIDDCVATEVNAMNLGGFGNKGIHYVMDGDSIKFRNAFGDTLITLGDIYSWVSVKESNPNIVWGENLVDTLTKTVVRLNEIRRENKGNKIYGELCHYINGYKKYKDTNGLLFSDAYFNIPFHIGHIDNTDVTIMVHPAIDKGNESEIRMEAFSHKKNFVIVRSIQRVKDLNGALSVISATIKDIYGVEINLCNPPANS